MSMHNIGCNVDNEKEEKRNRLEKIHKHIFLYTLHTDSSNANASDHQQGKRTESHNRHTDSWYEDLQRAF